MPTLTKTATTKVRKTLTQDERAVLAQLASQARTLLMR